MSSFAAMAHFAVICPPVSGHLDPLAAIGRALLVRGHRVTVFHVRDLEPKARAHGLDFVPLGNDDFPAGTLNATVAKLAALKGSQSLKFAIQCASAIAYSILHDGPDAFHHEGIDVAIVDQNEPAGASVAEHLGIPFVSVCTSLPLNRELSIPPPFVAWTYTTSMFGRIRNAAGYAVSDRFIAPIQKALNNYREKWNLPVLKTPDDSFSRIAQLAQMPREFDFPRDCPPKDFHYLGPWFDEHSARIPFPYEKLDGRPLIYGSIGTLQEEQNDMFRVMAEACAPLNAQLVLSLGHPESQNSRELPGNPLVVNYAPQLELLKRAAVTITHSGMNTTQQSLYFGVPMVAIPLAHDQPAIAARLARTGAGIVIPPSALKVERLRSALRSLLPNQNGYRTQAVRLRQAARASGGVAAAVKILERVAASSSSWATESVPRPAETR
jgi:zeaxanthin glucosyltransferase